MNGRYLSRCLLMAYGIFVLMLPLASYASVSESIAHTELSIASVYDAMSQPMLWEQSDPFKGHGSDNARQANAPEQPSVCDPPPKMRSPQMGVSSLVSPHIFINLPSWRGFIHYSIPPPAFLSA